MVTDGALLLGASALLVIGAVYAAGRGTGLLLRALRHGDAPAAALWLVRGIRGAVVGVALGALAVGILTHEAWVVILGAVFLAEELYETGVVTLILRHSPDASHG
jgi:hypothetical protein